MKRVSKSIWALTLAMSFVSVTATVLVAEIYCRIRLEVPPEQVLHRRRKDWVEVAELARVHEVAGMRQHSSFPDIPALRSKPLPRQLVAPGLTFVSKFDAVPYGPSGMLPGKWRSNSQLTDGTKTYDLEVNIDSWGRRETENPHPEKRKHYVLNFGCSFTYGSGVRDSETLPSRLAAALPSYHVYNYGLVGKGPQEAIARLEDMERLKEVPEADGVAIYLMMPDHIRRASPSLSRFLTNRHGWRYYEPDAQGNLSQVRGFYEEHWVFSLFNSLLSHSAILAYTQMDFPMSTKLAEYKRTAWLMAGMARMYREKFGNDRFFVVLYPSVNGYHQPSGIGPLLGEAGVKYLDYENTDIARYTRGSPIIHPLDSHPSAEAYRLVAERIAHDLF